VRAVLGTLGSLLLYLTGNGRAVFTTEPPSSTNLGEFSNFVQDAKFYILNPLCLDSSCSLFLPMFKTATKLVEAGWLTTVRDIEVYLTSALLVSD
jgi:hypothetical protein